MAKKKKFNTKNDKKSKIKVLAYCDSPTCATGFATVSRNILSGLYNTGRYDIDVLGINYWGDPHNFPFRIWPIGVNADRDPYGRKKSFGMIQQMEYDILFFLQDSFILDFLPELHNQLRTNNRKFRSIVYYPIDGRPKEKWIHNVDACDKVVAYSEFGKQESMLAFPEMKEPLVIPHGVNTKEFFVMNSNDLSEFRQRFFGKQADKFIFTNLNRNQQRKDIPRTIMAFAELKKKEPNTLLYLHMAKKDQGWDLPEVLKAHGLSINDDVVFPENFGPNQGYPRNIVNMIYNISDCVISTTLGEGFGLSWIEAMATKTPVIMPSNTMLPEFISDDLGWLVKSGTNPSLFTVVPNDNEVIRPLVDVDDMVDKMLYVCKNKEEVDRRALNAYNFVSSGMDWASHIVPKWVSVFDSAVEELNNDVVDVEGVNVIEAESF